MTKKKERLLPACADCGHLAMYHGDRAVTPCGPDKPPRLDDEGHLHYTSVERCRCIGYTVIPRA